MTKKTFVREIAKLNAYYVNFKLDTSQEIIMDVWYNALKVIDDEMFIKLINDYMMNNIYAPQSPTHIIEHLKNAMIRNKMSGDKAWELGFELLKEKRWSLIETSKALKSRGLDEIATSLEAIKSRLESLAMDSSQKPFVIKAFKEAYDSEVVFSIKTSLRLENNGLNANGSEMLDTKNIKMIKGE